MEQDEAGLPPAEGVVIQSPAVVASSAAAAAAVTAAAAMRSKVDRSKSKGGGKTGEVGQDAKREQGRGRLVHSAVFCFFVFCVMKALPN